MSNELTNALREECVKKALAHALDKRKEELRAKRCAFANEVLDDILGKGLRAWIETAPEGALPKIAAFYCIVGGDYVQLVLGGQRTVTDLLRRGNALATYSYAHPLSVRYRELDNEKRVLGAEEEKLRAEMRAVLNGCSTRKSLRERWPELVTLMGTALDDDEPDVKCRALVPSATLNERLGLPVEKKA